MDAARQFVVLRQIEAHECSLLSAVDIGHSDSDHCCTREKRLAGRLGEGGKAVAVGDCTAVGSAVGSMVVAGLDTAEGAGRVRETGPGFVWLHLLPYTKLSQT